MIRTRSVIPLIALVLLTVTCPVLAKTPHATGSPQQASELGLDGVIPIGHRILSTYARSAHQTIGLTGVAPDEDSGNLIHQSTLTVAAHQVFLPIVVSAGTELPEGILNGDFESGRVAWTEVSLKGWPLIVEADALPGSAIPHGGQWAAWLGGDNDEVSFILQRVTVPSNAPYLSYWHWIASEDVCGYDFGGVIVNNVVVDVYELCDDRDTNGWVLHTVDLRAYAGQEISLQIRAETDESLNSNLFIDDVEFTASALATNGGQEALSRPPSHMSRADAAPKQRD